MKARLLIATGVIALGVALIAFIPAGILESIANQRLAPTAQLRATSGTIWSGATVLQIAEAGKPLAARGAKMEVPIRWSFAPSSLLRLRLGADVTATGRALNGKFRLEAGVLSAQIRDADVNAAMDAIGRLNQTVSIFKPGGELQVRSTEVPWRIDYLAPNAMTGRLDFAASKVRMASIAGVPVGVPIGSYSGNLVFDGQRVNYKIDKSSGLISLIGGGHVAFDNSREFYYKGVATSLPGSPVWLASTLGGFGRTSPDGRTSIDYKTRW